jgi:outer membrane protein assembly factor BamA
MSIRLLASIAALAFIAAPRSITAQDACGEGLVVSRITMPETTHLMRSEQAAIRAQLIGHCLDEQHLGGLVEQVRDTLQSFGYFQATVAEPSMTTMDATRYPRTASLNLSFREGPRYIVGVIEIRGNRELSADEIRTVMPITPGDFFDITKVRETADAVRRLYAANGNPNASIVPDVVSDIGERKQPILRVGFTIIEGKQEIN